MKNILITGASKGVGRATALAFLERGHRVLALARSEALLKSLQEEAAELPGTLLYIGMALEDFSVADLPDEMAVIDVLIHNAGSLVNKSFAEISREELEGVYQTNVFAPFILTQQLLPHLAKRAHVITIGSVGGVNGTQKFPGLSAYSSSKAALSCLTECWQAEFAESELSFNSLALGSVQTEMLEAAFPGLTAGTTAGEMGQYIADFAFSALGLIKGKTLLVSNSTP